MTARGEIARGREVALVELVDRVLAGGVVLGGDIALSAADVDLLHVSLHALVTPASAAEEPGIPRRAADRRDAATIWVYGICEQPELPPPRRRGLAQAPLDGIREGALLSVITRHAHPPSDPALDALWVHDRVLERLMADRAVLPMRFGALVTDDASLRTLLAARQEAFLEALDRVRGRIEVGVRVMRRQAGAPGDAPSAVRDAATGRDYLLSRLRDERRLERAAGLLHEPLAALSLDARRAPTRTPDELLRASYLVDRSVLPRVRSTVERLQDAHPDAAILCTGPWPPYSFVAAHDAPLPEPAA